MSELDIEQPDQLLAYLRSIGRIEPDEQPDLRVLAGGVSNRTVLVARPGGEAWVLKQALAKLRVAVDWFSSPERIHREALALRWLPECAPPDTITGLVFEDHKHHILAMQAVPEPHANWKTLLLAGQLESDHIEQFGTLLGAIHRNASARRALIEPLFADRSFFESLRVEPYYEYTAGQVSEAAPFYTHLIAKTRAERHTLVHGDYSPKNILVAGGRLILLDHEVIHFGDPAFDLGFSLAHLLSKAHVLTQRRADFAAAALAYWRSYTTALGTTGWETALEPRAALHTLGCLLARVAGRSQLEYMPPELRQHQRNVVVGLMRQPPDSLAALIDRFISGINAGGG